MSPPTSQRTVPDRSAPLRRLARISVVLTAAADLLLALFGPLVSRSDAMGPLTHATSFVLHLILFAFVAKLGLRIMSGGGFGLAIGVLSFLLSVHLFALGVLVPSGRYLGTRTFLLMHIAFTIVVATSWVVTVTAAIKCMAEEP